MLDVQLNKSINVDLACLLREVCNMATVKHGLMINPNLSRILAVDSLPTTIPMIPVSSKHGSKG